VYNKDIIAQRINQILNLMTDLKKSIGDDIIRSEIKKRNKGVYKFYKQKLIDLLNKLN